MKTIAILVMGFCAAATASKAGPPDDCLALAKKIDEATSFVDSLEFQFEGDVAWEFLQPGVAQQQFVYDGECRYKKGAGFRFSTTDDYPGVGRHFEETASGRDNYQQYRKSASERDGFGSIVPVKSTMSLLWTGRNLSILHFACADLVTLVGPDDDFLAGVGGDGKSLRFVTHKLESPYTTVVKFDPDKGWAVTELTRSIFGKPWMRVDNVKHLSFSLGQRSFWLPVSFEISNFDSTVDPQNPKLRRQGGTPLDPKKKRRHPTMLFDEPMTRQRFRLLTNTIKINHLKSAEDVKVRFPNGLPVVDERRKDGKKLVVAGQPSFNAKNRKELETALETTVDIAQKQVEPLRLKNREGSYAWWLAGAGALLLAVGGVLIFRR